MPRQVSHTYEFGAFRIDPAERLLFSGESVVSLTPKVFDTLLILVENSGHVLGKEELMKQVWPDSFVEENNLAQNISILRKTLGESAEGLKYIETVPKRGYRFVAAVEQVGGARTDIIVRERARARIVIEEDDADEPNLQSLAAQARAAIDSLQHTRRHELQAEMDDVIHRAPETRYATSGDVNIAYQVVGKGSLDVVFVMGWVSHLEYFWEEPSFARFLTRLASFSRLILFDKRGTGLSDRVPNTELPTLEQRMDDVRTVMEAVKSERAALIGVSEGGPMCSLFAATYPERTIALVMIPGLRPPTNETSFTS
jgi:DNA-binding winged helix-turn-helix (wHTH) protein